MPAGKGKQLKEIFQLSLVEEMAGRVQANHPELNVAGFIAEIIADFPSLELMARARRIAMALRAHLPSSFPDAVAILLESTGEDDGSGGVEGDDGFRHLPF